VRRSTRSSRGPVKSQVWQALTCGNRPIIRIERTDLLERAAPARSRDCVRNNLRVDRPSKNERICPPVLCYPRSLASDLFAGGRGSCRRSGSKETIQRTRNLFVCEVVQTNHINC